MHTRRAGPLESNGKPAEEEPNPSRRFLSGRGGGAEQRTHSSRFPVPASGEHETRGLNVKFPGAQPHVAFSTPPHTCPAPPPARHVTRRPPRASRCVSARRLLLVPPARPRPNPVASSQLRLETIFPSLLGRDLG